MTPYRIVGQGLAGSILAWQLRLRGQKVKVIDRGDKMTSSRVAAGLITPITGGRLSASWRFRELWPTARMFYRRIEVETGARFLHEIPIAREFYDDDEAGRFEKKRDQLRGETGLNLPENSNGFEMPGAWLDVPRFLDVTREEMGTETGVFNPEEVASSEMTIFCQGWEGRGNPWFPELNFRAAKGQILEIESESIPRDRVINRRTWILPTKGNRFRVGATYEWDFEINGPTEEGRDELVERLAAITDAPYQIVGQSAGIRPIIRQSRPLVGWHPENRRVAFFNGLGSKGVLNAPWCAEKFAETLVGNGEIDPEIAWRT